MMLKPPLEGGGWGRGGRLEQEIDTVHSRIVVCKTNQRWGITHTRTDMHQGEVYIKSILTSNHI